MGSGRAAVKRLTPMAPDLQTLNADVAGNVNKKAVIGPLRNGVFAAA